MCVCVGGCLYSLHAPTYVFPSVRIYVVFLGGNEGLAFLQEECLLEVFTADSYFLRTVGCRKLKLSKSQWKEMNPIGVF